MQSKIPRISYNDKQYNKAVLLFDISLWFTFTYTKWVDHWKMEMIASFFQFQSWLDDQSENYWGVMRRDGLKAKQIYGQLVQVLDKLIGKQYIPMDEWKPHVMGHYICLDSIFSTYNRTQKERCAKPIKAYYQPNLDECEHFDGSNPINSIETLIEVYIK